MANSAQPSPMEKNASSASSTSKPKVKDPRKIHKLIIIGGGPAGIGVLVRAARIGYLEKLLNYDEESDRHGVVLIHSGEMSSVGAGNLGEYTIRSNTFAKSMVSSVLDDRLDCHPPEKATKTYLEPLRSHRTALELSEIGNTPVGLKQIGDFLREVGKLSAKKLRAHSPSSKFLLQTRATKIKVLEDKILKVFVSCDKNPENHEEYFAERVVLATGGTQHKPSLPSASHQKKLFLSDYVLREKGEEALLSYLKEKKSQKVCIVGGSHSSFSVAWVLLNSNDHADLISKQPNKGSPTDQNQLVQKLESNRKGEIQVQAPMIIKNASRRKPSSTLPSEAFLKESSTSKTFSKVVFKQRDITILHRSPIRCYYSSKREAEADGLEISQLKPDKSGAINTFSGLREDAKRLYQRVKSGCESRVRLFQIKTNSVSSVQMKAYDEAAAIIWGCGYETNMIPLKDAQDDEILVEHNQNHVCVNSSAELLPKQVISAKGNVKKSNNMRKGEMMQQGEEKTSVDSSSKEAPSTHEETEKVQKKALRGSTVSERRCEDIEVSTEISAPFKKGTVLGIGLGFGIPASVKEMNTDTRADGVAVYHRRGASLVLGAVFGSAVYGKNCESYEEMVEYGERLKKEISQRNASIVRSNASCTKAEVARKDSDSTPSSPRLKSQTHIQPKRSNATSGIPKDVTASETTTSTKKKTAVDCDIENTRLEKQKEAQEKHANRILNKYKTDKEFRLQNKRKVCPYCGCGDALGKTCKAKKLMEQKSKEPTTTNRDRSQSFNDAIDAKRMHLEEKITVNSSSQSRVKRPLRNTVSKKEHVGVCTLSSVNASSSCLAGSGKFAISGLRAVQTVLPPVQGGKLSLESEAGRKIEKERLQSPTITKNALKPNENRGGEGRKSRLHVANGKPDPIQVEAKSENLAQKASPRCSSGSQKLIVEGITQPLVIVGIVG